MHSTPVFSVASQLCEPHPLKGHCDTVCSVPVQFMLSIQIWAGVDCVGTSDHKSTELADA